MYTALTAFLVLGSLLGSAEAASPDVGLIVKRMRAALEPERPSARKMTFRISGADDDASRVVVGQASSGVGDRRRILTVVLSPESLRGTAYLVEQSSADEDVQWLYLPAIDRVRKVVSPEAYAAFLNSDFTYSDLGMIGRGTRYTLLGEEEQDGTHAYRIEGVPKQTWYYGRTVSWVAADSGLPLQRRLYDAAKQLWKVERWEDVSVVDGVPTTMHVSMNDVQARTRTDINVSAVRYDVDVSDTLFDPSQLPKAAASPLWTQLEGRAER